MSGSCPSEELLLAFAEGRCPDAERAGVERHLADCDACCSIVAVIVEDRGPPGDGIGSSSGSDPARCSVSADTLGRSPASIPAMTRGEQIGRYVLLECVGRGGMGVVWSAYDPKLDRRIAIKLLRTDPGLASESADRLLHEAQSMARLAHPNVVGVHDVGTVGEQVFIAMEFVEGHTLREWLREAPRAVPEIVARFLAAGRGLAAAHDRGVVHRDFKPDNVLCSREGRVYVTDFGLAHRHADVPEPVSREEIGARPLERITRTGAFVGTPAYMAPEQFAGARSDARSDQFSFCVALWEAITGARPFTGRSLEELAASVVLGRIPARPSGSRLPADLERALRRGLAVDPAERWPAMTELLAAIGRDPSARRRRLVSGLVVIGLAGSVGGLALRDGAREVPCSRAAEHLVSVWDDERRDAVAHALASIERPWTAVSAAAVERRLDEQAADWIAMHTEACEATLRGEQSPARLDQRMACLERRRRELDALVDVLATADATVAERSVQAASSLTPASACADVGTLATESPTPDDESAAAAVDAARELLGRAETLGRAGLLHDALDTCDPIVAYAQALAWPPLRAEALTVRGRLRRMSGDYPQARADLEQAWETALEADHDRASADAAAELVVLASKANEYDDGLKWGRHALALARRIGRDDEPEAFVHAGIGLLLLHRGDAEAAGVELREALRIREAVHGPTDVRTAESIARLGDLSVALGELETAIEHYQRAIEGMEAQLGPEHPSLVAPVLNLGTAYYQQRDVASAEREFSRALGIHTRTHVGLHPDAITILTNLGNVDLIREDWAAAAGRYQRAHDIAIALFGPDHLQVGIALVNLGTVRRELGDLEGARAAFARTLELWEAGAPNNPALAYPLAGLGITLADLHEPARALPYLERAVELRTTHPSGPADLAQVELALAAVLWDTGGDRQRAVSLARSAEQRLAPLGEVARTHRHDVDVWLAAHDPETSPI
jgi:tetratricopeptide (TPR) repeat protein/predicted Ser/Thr protein kinase